VPGFVHRGVSENGLRVNSPSLVVVEVNVSSQRLSEDVSWIIGVR
jgi:hypothetical protein